VIAMQRPAVAAAVPPIGCWSVFAPWWLGSLACWLTVALPCSVDAAELHAATFVVDVTPSLGASPCVGYQPDITTIEHPLEARGLLLRWVHPSPMTPGANSPPSPGASEANSASARMTTVALIAIDSCGLCGPSYDRCCRAVAEVLQTPIDHVAIQSLHQHTAPALDSDAVQLLWSTDEPRRMRHFDYESFVASQLATAAKAAHGRWQPVVRMTGGIGSVQHAASNRRVPLPDGSIGVRGSVCRDPVVREAPEGLIDPFVRCITLFGADGPVVQCHYYASHPQTYYGDGRVTSDVPGLARNAFQQETGIPQIYFTGCGGNVTFGKYNEGNAESRQRLADRVVEGMRTASRQSRETPVVEAVMSDLSDADFQWLSVPLRFPLRDDAEFAVDRARQILNREQPGDRIKAGMYVAWYERRKAMPDVPTTGLHLGPFRLLQLPGEPFVELQLAAQRLRPNDFVCVAGYGECAVWYYGPDQIYRDRGGYEQTYSFTGPCEALTAQTLRQLLALQEP
jgi:hypothetical protein